MHLLLLILALSGGEKEKRAMVVEMLAVKMKGDAMVAYAWAYGTSSASVNTACFAFLRFSQARPRPINYQFK